MSHKCARDRNRRLKKLYNETKNAYGGGAWFDKKKNRLIKYSVHSKPYKIRCRRATRRRLNRINEDVIHYGSHYKKYYDYWNEIL